MLGMFADTARIEQHGVGFFRIGRQFVSRLSQRSDHQFTIEHIHLTSDGLDEQFAVMCFWL
jgi:hypothetical protein